MCLHIAVTFPMLDPDILPDSLLERLQSVLLHLGEKPSLTHT
jgi:hypothetical protein